MQAWPRLLHKHSHYVNKGHHHHLSIHISWQIKVLVRRKVECRNRATVVITWINAWMTRTHTTILTIIIGITPPRWPWSIRVTKLAPRLKVEEDNANSLIVKAPQPLMTGSVLIQLILYFLPKEMLMIDKSILALTMTSNRNIPLMFKIRVILQSYNIHEVDKKVPPQPT